MKAPTSLKKLFMKSHLGRKTWTGIRQFYLSHLVLTPNERLQKYGTEAIREIHSILTSAGLPYYADYGTLLGIVREGGFIRHDDDIDFSVPPGSPSPKCYLQTLLSSRDLVFWRGFEYRGRITELAFWYRGVPIDFFFSVVEDGVIYNYAYNDMPGREDWIPYRERREINGKFELRLINGQAVVIPENYDAILTTKYGAWRTPLDFKISGRNVVSEGLIPPEYTEGFARIVKLDRIKELG